MKKLSLYDISWKVPEEEYRKDSSLSYSTLAKYERGGFNNLKSLFEPISTTSLDFGSAVDTLLTGTKEEFQMKFTIGDVPNINKNAIPIVRKIYNEYSNYYKTLEEVCENEGPIVETILDSFEYRMANTKTRMNYFIKTASNFYKFLKQTNGKIILDTNTYNDVINTVNKLKTAPATSWCFSPENENTEIFYQLKFKASFNNINYRCMADIIVVDHEHKEIYPVDLKTSSKEEFDFYKSFKDWRYDIQARLYWRIINDNLQKNEIFKNYKLHNYIFIVANRFSLNPLSWEFEKTKDIGILKYGYLHPFEFRDPFTIGEELSYYLTYSPKVPKGITEYSPNSLDEWLQTL